MMTFENIHASKIGAVLAFLFSLALVPASSSGQSAPTQTFDVYRFQIEGSFGIKERCKVGGQTVPSLVKIYLDPTQDLQGSLTDAYVKVRVCTLGSASQVKVALPLVLPLSAITESLDAPTGSVQIFPFAKARLAAHFTAGDGPDTVVLKKIKNSNGLNWFELKLTESSSGTVRVGPVRLGFSGVEALKGISGFQPEAHLPLKKIEIDVPAREVTLKAELMGLTQEQE